MGANKGFNVNSFLQAFQQGWVTSATQWHNSLFSSNTSDHSRGGEHPYSEPSFHNDHPRVPAFCGACAACLELAPARRGASNVTVLAVELMSTTVRLLRRNFERFGVPGQVIHGAASSEEGTVQMRVAPPGEEGLGLDVKRGWAWRLGGTETVRKTTVDALTREATIGKVDLLSIDAEGHDDEVLRGAEETLNRTTIVEFEYHFVGLWATRPLSATIARLEALRFQCFWQGNSGRLAHANADECLVSLSERFWSNLVCTREPKVLRIFEAFA